MAKVLTGSQLMDKTYKDVEGISQELRDSIGDIEDTFSAIIWGDSGNGKTSLALKVISELQASLGTVLYLGYEEGHGKSFMMALKRSTVKLDKIKIMSDCTFDELVEILKRKLSPKIVVIDSIQYSGFTIVQYKALKKMFLFGKSQNARKILIFISHCSGKLPDGKTALKIRYDANIKIWVKGFMGIMISRLGHKKNFVIYEAGAKEHWGDKFEDISAEIGKKRVKKTIKKKKDATATADKTG